MPKRQSLGKNAKLEKKLDPTVVTAALIALVGTIITAVFASPVITALIQKPPDDQANPIVLTAIAQVTAVHLEPVADQISKCEWLLKNFPQSQEAVEAFFGNENLEVQLLYHQCTSGPVVQGAILISQDGAHHGIWITNGACADGVPDPEFDTSSFRGKRRQLNNTTDRVFEGILLSAEPITYWAWCDEIH